MTDAPMTSSTARTALVETPTPGRWAKQLASHLGRPGKMSVEQTSAGPRLSMTFDGGQAACLMDTSAPDVLALHVTADDEAALERMSQVVGSHLERFGEKAGLRVVWAEASR